MNKTQKVWQSYLSSFALVWEMLLSNGKKPKRLCSPLKFSALRGCALWSTSLSTWAAEGLFLHSTWEEMGVQQSCCSTHGWSSEGTFITHSSNNISTTGAPGHFPTYCNDGVAESTLPAWWICSCQKTPRSVMPFGQVLSWILAGKRGTGRGVQRRSARPWSQAAGSWSSTVTAALALVCALPGSWGSADMLRDSKCSYLEFPPPLSLTNREMLCTQKSPVDNKRASLVVFNPPECFAWQTDSS